MPSLILLMLLLTGLPGASVWAATALPAHQYTLAEPHQPIDLQTFINNEKAAYQGKITIVPPLNLSFTGVLKTLSQKKTTGYLYTALQVMQISPLPAIEYQAFIGAPADGERGGEVISVYIDNRLATALETLDANALINQRRTWYGYHIYNFSRGPALVLENVELENAGLSADKAGR